MIKYRQTRLTMLINIKWKYSSKGMVKPIKPFKTWGIHYKINKYNKWG